MQSSSTRGRTHPGAPSSSPPGTEPPRGAGAPGRFAYPPAVGPDGAAALERDLIAVVERASHPRGDAIAVPAEYLEVVAVRR